MTRDALLTAIEATSFKVREMQTRLKQGDSGVKMQDVANEVRKLLTLQKELKSLDTNGDNQQQQYQQQEMKEKVTKNQQQQEQEEPEQVLSSDEDSNQHETEEFQEQQQQQHPEDDKDTDQERLVLEIGDKVTDLETWLAQTDVVLGEMDQQLLQINSCTSNLAFLQSKMQDYEREQQARYAEQLAVEEAEEEAKRANEVVAAREKEKLQDQQLQPQQQQQHHHHQHQQQQQNQALEQPQAQSMAQQVHEKKTAALLASKESQLAKLTTRLESLQQEKEQLQQQVACADKTRASIQEQLVRAQRDLSKLQLDAIIDQKQVEELSRELTKTKEELEHAQSMSHALKNKSESLEDELLKTRLEKQELQTAMQVVQSEQELNQSQKVALMSEMAKIKDEMTTLATQKQQLQAQVDELQSSQTASQNQRHEEAQSLQEMTHKLSELHHLLTKANETVSVEQVEKDRLQKEMAEMNEKFLSMSIAEKQALEEAARLKSTIEKLTQDMQSLRHELSKMHTQNEALVANSRVAEEEHKRVQTIVLSQEEMIKKTRLSMLEANEELKESRKHVQKWKQSSQTVSTQLKEKSSEADRLRTLLAKSKTELNASNSSRIHLGEMMKGKDRKLSQLITDFDKLKREMREQEDAQKRMWGKVETLIKEKTRLERDTESLAMQRTVLGALLPIVLAVVVMVFFLSS